MFSKWFDKSSCPIGIDFGAYSIKMMQLHRMAAGEAGPADWKIHARAERALPTDLPAGGPERIAALTKIVSEMRSDGPFVGKCTIASLPTASIQFKNLRLPEMPPDEMQAAVEWEAADRLQQAAPGHGAAEATAAAYLQYFDAGEVRQGEDLRQEIILMAVPATTVHEHLDVLTGAGLRPAAIECAPAALERAVSGNRKPDLEAPADVIIDVGFGSSKVLIARANRIVFFKFIDIGGRKFNEVVAQRLNIPIADAAEMRRKAAQRKVNGLARTGDPGTPGNPVEHAIFDAIRPAAAEVAREISLCLRYYSVTFRGRRPETAILVGGEANSPQLASVLSDEAGLTVAPAKGIGGADGAWMIAAGLSMRNETLNSRTKGASAIEPAKGKEAA